MLKKPELVNPNVTSIGTLKFPTPAKTFQVNLNLLVEPVLYGDLSHTEKLFTPPNISY